MMVLTSDIREIIENGKLIVEERGVVRDMTDHEAVEFLKFKLWLTGGCKINETTVKFERHGGE